MQFVFIEICNADIRCNMGFALALDKLERSGVNLSIGQPNTTQLLKEALCSNCFHGVSGLVKFDPATGFADRTFVVTKVEQPVGYTNSAVFPKFGKTIISIPDGIEVQMNTIHSAATAIFATITLTLMALIITTHVITKNTIPLRPKANI